MRRILQRSVLGLAAAVVTACTPETVIETENIPTAGLRFIHAVPDTGAVDFRPVDIVENSTFYGVTFRSTAQLQYKNARAGDRQFRIFQSGTTPEVASKVLWEGTLKLEAGKRYTAILWGFARSGSSPAMQLRLLEDNPADPGTSITFRTVNAAVGIGGIDVRVYLSSGSAPAAATWSSVAPLVATNYVTSPVGATTINVAPSGGGAALFTTACSQTGLAATVDVEAIPGTNVAGSGLSAFIMPRAVAGSQATQTFTTPGLICVWDRRPQRAPGV